MMPDYSREQDIGKPTKESVVVEDLATIVTAIETATHTLDEAVENLKKIALGTGLVTGVDLNEKETE